MSVTCQTIIDQMEQLAPKKLAEEWDNVGLLVGSPSHKVDRVLVALDVTDDIIDYAIKENVQMIVAHHPFLFRPMKQIRTDWAQGAMIEKLLVNGIAVYAAHTNLDIAEGGVNDVLAERIGLTDIEPLTVTSRQNLVKLVVFVPKDSAEDVRAAIAKAGAGYIGEYSDCAFMTDGTGVFLPREGTSPYIGEKGSLTRVEEVRIETIMPEEIERRVVRAMLRAHPYEEVAYDIYPLKNTGREYGLGRIGSLAEELPLGAVIDRIKEAVGVPVIKFTGSPERMIKKVAVCGGSGSDLIPKAAMRGADLLLTADVKYHDGQKADENDIAVADAGHYYTEALVVPVVADYLRAQMASSKRKADIITAEGIANDVFSFR